MMNKRDRKSVRSLRLRNGLAGGVLLAGAYALPAAAAQSACTTAVVNAFKVQDVTVTSVSDVAAANGQPEYCQVIAAVKTDGEGAGPGLASFKLNMPVNWNNRFLFVGCGGECGSINTTSVGADDLNEALPQGYVVVNTDTGHTDPTDAWTLTSPGVPNEPALIDFYYRAIHQVTLVAKEMVAKYYNSEIDYAYFDGCSTGGRQALMEADRYPDDYDGVIAGDPVMAFPEVIMGHLKNLKEFAPANAYLPASTLAAVDAAVQTSCDAADGVADGLAQNPAGCNFNPDILVPSVLTHTQAKAIKQYMTALYDNHGRLVYPGYSETDLSTVGFLGTWTEEACPPVPGTGPNPWSGETATGCSAAGPSGLNFSQPLIATIIELNANYDAWDDFPLNNGVVTDSALRLSQQTLGQGSSNMPADLTKFLNRGGKLIQYHGFSDPSVSPYQSIWFQKGLAQMYGGFDRLQKSARLFMVPGMGHCSGGPGPNTFDTLSALDAWVSRDQAPDGIIATNATTGRTMPLCKFPEQARYVAGDMNKASSWSCQARDQRMLDVGSAGERAGAAVDDDPQVPLAAIIRGGR